MASEPPMDLRIAATASAWARVFSPVSRDSPAMKGSAKARARASASACCGMACSVAAISSGTWAESARSAVRLFIVLSQQERGHGLDLVVGHEGRRVAHAFKFNEARPGPAPGHGQSGFVREHVRVDATRDQG